MKTKITIFVVAGLLVCLGAAAPGAQAQGNCTMATFSGTYAIYDRGSSLVGNLNEQPYQLHWSEAAAPFIAVGQVTFMPSGVGNGFYWMLLGSLNTGLEPVPVAVTITEMNPDCTGKFTYSLNLPGAPVATVVEERFILLDNGREYRSVPTSIENGIPTLTWLGTGRRIRKYSETVNTCAAQPIHGTYLLQAENIIANDLVTAVYDTLLVPMDVSITGAYTGTLYEKLGPISPIELPVWGTFTVNPDCSYSQVFEVDIYGVVATIDIRGVFFNEGKEFYGMAITPGGGIKYSFAQGKRIGP